MQGLLLVDKPEGPTSHDLVVKVRETLGVRKVGHAGTLDPMASGLLLVMVGSATRLSEYLVGLDKVYEAQVRLGMETTTDDREGAPLCGTEGWKDFDAGVILDALHRLEGVQRQVPPAYSAKKVGGEAAYRLVRRGETVELDSVEVEIFRAEALEIQLPDVYLRIHCSSGTYVRALARDLGRILGVGGHLTRLRRTAVGRFRVEEALPWDTLEGGGTSRLQLLSPADALAHLPAVGVEEDEVRHLRQGRPIRRPGLRWGPEEPIRILRGGELVAIARQEGSYLRPRKVMVGG